MKNCFEKWVDKLLLITNGSKYCSWYIGLCKNGYERGLDSRFGKDGFEHHHVFPKSFENNNFVVKLTLREHFVAHKLLTKMFDDTDKKRKMFYALSCFAMGRQLSSRQYAQVRIAAKLANSGRVVSEETRTKQSNIRKGKPAHNKGKPGKKVPCTPEKASNISIARLKTVKIVCEFCGKECDPGNYKRWHSTKCKTGGNVYVS